MPTTVSSPSSPLPTAALGTIHSSRWATGQGNSLRVRVYGDQGAIEVDLDRAYDEYRICSRQRRELLYLEDGEMQTDAE